MICSFLYCLFENPNLLFDNLEDHLLLIVTDSELEWTAEFHEAFIFSPGVVLLTKLFLNLFLKFLLDFQEFRIYFDFLSSLPILPSVEILKWLGLGDLETCFGLDFSGRCENTLDFIWEYCISGELHLFISSVTGASLALSLCFLFLIITLL